MLRTIGDELISSETVAVMELVKNAYDADARRVLIRFCPPLKIGSGAIEVLDDGEGMTPKTVLSVWMEPATPNRKRSSRSKKLQRPILGEKGIGRFAAARLGGEMEVFTRTKGRRSEVHLTVRWDDFEDVNRYLDEVTVRWNETSPTVTAATGTLGDLRRVGSLRSAPRSGTVLRMSELTVDWGRDELEELRTGLSRLISPVGRKAPDFAIALDLPEEFEDLNGTVKPPPSVGSPDYRIIATVTAAGKADLKLSARSANRESTRNRAGVDVWQRSDRSPKCGPLEIELRMWDRDTESLRRLVDEGKGRTLTEVRRDLNAAAGISVYRNGFRVFPYGEPENDWLRLDLRRVQNPTMRASNNQIVGFVRISAGRNPRLRDQSNREGLIAGRALDDLRRIVRNVLGLLEERRYEARRAASAKTDSEDGPSNPVFDVELTELASTIRDHHADDAELVDALERTEEKVAIDVDRVKEVVSRYQRLAALGQLIDVVLHDGRTPLAKLTAEAEAALDDLKTIPSETRRRNAVSRKLRFIEAQASLVSAVFDRIEPFASRTRGQPKKMKLEDAIVAAFQIYASEIDKLGVEVTLPSSSTMVTMDSSELQRVIVNLLTNSLHWLGTVRHKRKIEVQVRRHGDHVEIVFSDNGPGVKRSARRHIFEPYFTTKDDGIGLGLAIAGEIVTDFYGGSLDLVQNGPLPGATFRATLRRRI